MLHEKIPPAATFLGTMDQSFDKSLVHFSGKLEQKKIINKTFH